MPSQREFITSDARVSAFVAGIGSGKTRSSVLKALSMPEGSIGMLISPTYTMLRDTMLRTFNDIARDLVVDFNKSDMHAKLIDGKEILFRSSDNSERLRGANLGWAGLDEAALMSRDTLDIVIGRLRLSPGKMWFTTTPKGKNHWLFDYLERDTVHTITAKTFDNPFLPQAYIDELKLQYTSQFYRQEVLGEFVDFGGNIFHPPLYYNELPNTFQIGMAFDAAYTAKDTADYSVILAGRFSAGKLYIEDMYRSQVEAGEFVRVLELWQKIHPTKFNTRIGGTEKALISWLKREGIKVNSEATKGDKLANAQPTAAAWNRGDILVPSNAPWLQDMLNEVTGFNGVDDKHDDIVDTLVTLWNSFQKSSIGAKRYY